MKMSFIDRTLYPKFYSYVRDDLPTVANVSSIRRAFERYGQLDRAGLKRALKWGESPTLDVTTLVDEYGGHDVGTDVIEIDRDLVKDFEAGRDWVRNKSGARVRLAGVTVLHELIHWADLKDGKDYRAGAESGELFERAVYGKVLG